jgi:hypothetical protein
MTKQYLIHPLNRLHTINKPNNNPTKNKIESMKTLSKISSDNVYSIISYYMNIFFQLT